jgi:hypothetical protein
MAQHKWHKEIKAWVDGAEIESRTKIDNIQFTDWMSRPQPAWETGSNIEYRIKPQPKEPQYLHVYKGQGYEYYFSTAFHESCTFGTTKSQYIGKIKLED